MKRLLLRGVIDAAAFMLAVLCLPGLAVPDGPLALGIVAVGFAAISALARPFRGFLTVPVFLIAVGPILFGINMATFWLTTALSRAVGFEFTIAGLGPLVLGTLTIGAVRIFALPVMRWTKTRYRERESNLWIDHLEHQRDWFRTQVQNRG